MHRPRLVCLLLVLITVLVYLPVWRHGFVDFDDTAYLVENRIVQNGLTWSGLKWAFTTWHTSNWHPLTWLSHMLDCQWFGPNAGAHHFISVLFHAANAVLFFLVFHRTTAALWPSAFVAAMFAWHPLHVESVAWASERKDVLSTTFWALTLWAYARYAQTSGRQNRSADTRAPVPFLRVFRSGDYCLALFFFTLGLMAKPMLVTLPFVMVLLDYWPLRRVSTHAGPASRLRPAQASVAPRTARAELSVLFCLLKEKWPFIVLAGAASVVTYLAQRSAAVASLDQVPLGLRLFNALTAYTRYLAKAIWPVDLAVLYPMPAHINWIQGAASAAVLALMSVSFWFARRRHPYALVGWLWYLGTLVPVIGLVQVGTQAMADRYTYVPLLGVFLIVAFAGRDFTARFRLGKAAIATTTGLVLAGCLFATTKQLRFWRDSESLFAHAVAVTKDNAVANAALADALARQGQNEQALIYYREALRLSPNQADTHNNLANLLDALGKRAEALSHYHEALRLEPDVALQHCNLGALLVKLGRFDEAWLHYTEAQRLERDNPRPHYLMGRACLLRDRNPEAIAHFRDALRLDANHVESMISLSRILAADENPQVRNGADAVALAERADNLSGGQQVLVLDVLGMAYAEIGRFAAARTALERAIALASGTRREDVLPGLQERLRLYQSGIPYRDPRTNPPPANSTN